MKTYSSIAACILLWGFWAFLPKIATRYLHPMDALLYELSSVVLVSLAVLMVYRPRIRPDRSSAIAFGAGVAGAAGFLLYLFAVARQDASLVAPFTALYLVFPVILGFFFLKEKLSALNYLGVAMALAAVILLAG